LLSRAAADDAHSGTLDDGAAILPAGLQVREFLWATIARYACRRLLWLLLTEGRCHGMALAS